MIELKENTDKSNKPTIVFNTELLFDNENYIINRLGEIGKSGLVTNVLHERQTVLTKFPNMIKEMDVSSDFFELKRLFEELLDKGYNVVLLNIVPNHPDIALGLTQRHDKLKYHLGKELVKRMNLVSLDYPEYAMRYTNVNTLAFTDGEADYSLSLNGMVTEFTWTSNIIPTINNFLEAYQTNA